MKRLSVLLVIGIVALLVAPAYASVASVNAAAKAKPESPCDNTLERCTTPLIAGQFYTVGEVSITWDGDDHPVVTYEITDLNWSITAIHFEVSAGPITEWAPGQYFYGFENLNTQYFQFVAEDFQSADCLYFAAHAVVTQVIGYDEPDLEGFAAALPDQVTITVAHPGSGFGSPSYFDVTVSGGTVLDGTYDDWCIDTVNHISPGGIYTANVYSSYEDLASLGYLPADMALVNWIINQGFVGMTSPTCGGSFTYQDVQKAIWEILGQTGGGLSGWNRCRVDEIKAAAYANGVGFVPGCWDLIAVILVPVDGSQITIAQITFAEVEVPCTPILGEGSETAWGCGVPIREKKNWGWYFMCCH